MLEIRHAAYFCRISRKVVREFSGRSSPSYWKQ